MNVKVDALIDMFQYNDIDPHVMAKRIFDFTDYELRLLDIFWEPFCNTNFIKLTHATMVQLFEENKDMIEYFNMYPEYVISCEDFKEIVKLKNPVIYSYCDKIEYMVSISFQYLCECFNYNHIMISLKKVVTLIG